MFKKFSLTVFLFLILTGSSIAEVTENITETEELSPIAQCDIKYDQCAEKCAESSSENCLDTCTELADQCYDRYMSEIESAPPVIDTENEPQYEAEK